MAQNDQSQLGQLLERANTLLGTDLPGAIQLLESFREEYDSSASYLNALAECYYLCGRTMNVLMALDRLIEIGAATAETWSMAGLLLSQVKEYAQAIEAYRRSVEMMPDDAGVRHDYGKALYEMGDVAAAVRQMERACELSEELLPWQSLATMAPGNPEYTNADVFRVRHRFCEVLAQKTKMFPVKAPTQSQASGKLRVGYLSSWFHRENYMKPVWGLINKHDRGRIQLHVLTDTPANNLPGYEPHDDDRVHETRNLENQELAAFIQKVGIDVLVDLNAYSTLPRMGLFLTPPAPVTVAWFNMYATSGFPGFHYIIGDDQTVTAEEESFYSEKIARLPQSYLSFVVSHDAPEVVDPPCLKNGYVTFGSLSSQYKMTLPVFDAWAEILRHVPQARLLLGNVCLGSACNRDFVRDRFVERGVDPERLEFRGKAPHREFLEYYNSIDIALDPFPYNGGTTTMEAIWQGVPMLTFFGDRWASRTSASILAGTHLADCVATNVDGYIASAVELAGRLDVGPFLRVMRHTMREQLRKSPVCNTESFARAMEDLYFDLVGRTL